MPRLLSLGVIVAMGLVGCGKPTPEVGGEPPEPPPPVEPVRVGLLLPLSGDQASFGRDAVRGAELAIAEINARGGVLNRPLELARKDTGSQTETVEPLMLEFAEDATIAAVVGEIASARSLAAATAAQSAELPLVSPASTHAEVTRRGEWIFRTCYADPFQAEAMAGFANSVQARKVAVLTEEGNPYSEALAESFKKHFTTDGGEIVAVETFRSGESQFEKQIAAIKAAAPDLVYLPVYFREAAEVIREARRLDLEVPFLGADGWDSPEFISIGGEAVNHSYLPNHFSHEQGGAPTFVGAFSEKFGEPPPPLSALTYDAIRVVASAIERAGSTSRPAVRDALASAPPYHGVTGRIAFGPDRTPAKPAVILRVENGRFTYLETIEPSGQGAMEAADSAEENEADSSGSGPEDTEEQAADGSVNGEAPSADPPKESPTPPDGGGGDS